jgi:polyferredoxin
MPMNTLLKMLFVPLFILSIHNGYSATTDQAPVTAITTSDEFKSTDEFSEFKETPLTEATPEPACEGTCSLSKNEEIALRWVIGVLFATIIAGIFVRFRATRNFRAVFIVASVVILGFYRGACPCPIESLQHGFLNLFGHGYKWQTLLYFLGLLPITYVFGRVFCGWICHLGALQELLFMGSRFRLLQSEKAQSIMRMIRGVALVTLLVQILITQTILFKKVDPFAIVFNFHSLYLAGWVLVGILILSSVLLFRPFCKTLCPIGLILGFVSKIPGASVLGVSSSCISCSHCNTSCKINAITHDTKISRIENQECIRCGDCFDGCRKNAINVYFKGKNHGSKSECKNNAN